MQIEQCKTIQDMILFSQKFGKGIDAKFVAEQKANENFSVTPAANWYDASGIESAIKDMTTQRGHLLSRLSAGYEGNNLPVSYPVPYNITNQFMKGKTEWTDSARPAISATAPTDAKGTITQQSFIIQFNVTDEMIKHSTDKQLYDKIVEMAAKAYVSTVEGCIINGDAETGGTGNVNSDDQAPATTFGSAAYHSLLIDHGIRESAINATASKVDVGAFDSDDIISVLGKMGATYKGRMSEIIVAAEPSTYLTMMTDDGLKLAINTRNASVDGGTMRPFGLDLISHDLVPMTEADGKVSATPSNNTKGQFVAVYAPAVRWGLGNDMKIEVERIQGYGFTVTATVQFGFVILDAANTCAVGYDVTLV